MLPEKKGQMPEDTDDFSMHRALPAEENQGTVKYHFL